MHILYCVVVFKVSQGMVGQVSARRAAGVILEMIKVRFFYLLYIVYGLPTVANLLTNDIVLTRTDCSSGGTN